MIWNKPSEQISLTQKLAVSLQRANLNVEFQRADQSTNETDSVMLTLPDKSRDKVLLAELTFASAAAPDSLGKFDYLQFYVPLLINILPENFESTAVICEQLNARIPLIGFNLSNFEKVTVAFRHMMLVEADQFNPRLVLHTVKLIHFLIDEYTLLIEAIATGQKTLAEIEL